MGFKLNGVDTEGLPEYIVKTFKDACDIPYFVETGTAGGESIAVASRLFMECHTIELIEGRVISKSLPNVTYWTGDSSQILVNIISGLRNMMTFFFLDAHFSDSVPNTSGYKECPVLDEMRAIASHQNCIILIDDARLFFGHPPFPCDPREWPMIEEVFAKSKIYFPNHHTTIIDDFILIYPDHLGDAVSAEWRKRFTVRYPSASDKLKSEVQSVYNSFKKYVGE